MESRPPDPYVRVHAVNVYVRDQERSLRFYLDKLGFRSSDTVALTLHQVPGDLLGKPDEGFGQAMEVLAGGRVGVAAMAVGIGRACLEESTAYARRRRSAI